MYGISYAVGMTRETGLVRTGTFKAELVLGSAMVFHDAFHTRHRGWVAKRFLLIRAVIVLFALYTGVAELVANRQIKGAVLGELARNSGRTTGIVQHDITVGKNRSVAICSSEIEGISGAFVRG